VNTQVSEAEFAVLEEHARLAGLTLSEWVREMLLAAPVEPDAGAGSEVEEYNCAGDRADIFVVTGTPTAVARVFAYFTGSFPSLVGANAFMVSRIVESAYLPVSVAPRAFTPASRVG
jgi:hypothetical protein